MSARILSLVPAATDWVVELGCAEQLVGVTHECDVPAGLHPEVAVTPAVAADLGDPAAVDAAVTASAQAGQPLYRLDPDQVARLAPTVVLTQELCEVCAVSPATVEAVAATAGDPQVTTLRGVTLEGVLEDALRVGSALGAFERAAALVARLRGRLDTVAEAVRDRARPPVAVVEWPEPVWVAGHWVPDQIAAAGGVCVAGEPGAPSRRGSWAELDAAAVTVLGPCGYGLDEVVAHGPSHVPGDVAPLWAMDADRELSRPSAGAVTGVETLARILHPEVVGPPDPASARLLRPSPVPLA